MVLPGERAMTNTAGVSEELASFLASMDDAVNVVPDEQLEEIARKIETSRRMINIIKYSKLKAPVSIPTGLFFSQKDKGSTDVGHNEEYKNACKEALTCPKYELSKNFKEVISQYLKHSHKYDRHNRIPDNPLTCALSIIVGANEDFAARVDLLFHDLSNLDSLTTTVTVSSFTKKEQDIETPIEDMIKTHNGDTSAETIAGAKLLLKDDKKLIDKNNKYDLMGVACRIISTDERELESISDPDSLYFVQLYRDDCTISYRTVIMPLGHPSEDTRKNYCSIESNNSRREKTKVNGEIELFGYDNCTSGAWLPAISKYSLLSRYGSSYEGCNEHFKKTIEKTEILIADISRYWSKIHPRLLSNEIHQAICNLTNKLVSIKRPEPEFSTDSWTKNIANSVAALRDNTPVDLPESFKSITIPGLIDATKNKISGYLIPPQTTESLKSNIKPYGAASLYLGKYLRSLGDESPWVISKSKTEVISSSNLGYSTHSDSEALGKSLEEFFTELRPEPEGEQPDAKHIARFLRPLLYHVRYDSSKIDIGKITSVKEKVYKNISYRYFVIEPIIYTCKSEKIEVTGTIDRKYTIGVVGEQSPMYNYIDKDRYTLMTVSSSGYASDIELKPYTEIYLLSDIMEVIDELMTITQESAQSLIHVKSKKTDSTLLQKCNIKAKSYLSALQQNTLKVTVGDAYKGTPEEIALITHAALARASRPHHEDASNIRTTAFALLRPQTIRRIRSRDTGMHRATAVAKKKNSTAAVFYKGIERLSDKGKSFSVNLNQNTTLKFHKQKITFGDQTLQASNVLITMPKALLVGIQAGEAKTREVVSNNKMSSIEYTEYYGRSVVDTVSILISNAHKLIENKDNAMEVKDSTNKGLTNILSDLSDFNQLPRVLNPDDYKMAAREMHYKSTEIYSPDFYSQKLKEYSPEIKNKTETGIWIPVTCIFPSLEVPEIIDSIETRSEMDEVLSAYYGLINPKYTMVASEEKKKKIIDSIGYRYNTGNLPSMVSTHPAIAGITSSLMGETSTDTHTNYSIQEIASLDFNRLKDTIIEASIGPLIKDTGKVRGLSGDLLKNVILGPGVFQSSTLDSLQKFPTKAYYKETGEQISTDYRTITTNNTKIPLVKLQIGTVNIVISIKVKFSEESSITSLRFYLNGYPIKRNELIPVTKNALCFDTQEGFDKFADGVSKCSLAFREILTEGIMVNLKIGSAERSKTIFLELEREKKTAFLIIRNKEDKIISKIKMKGGLGSLSSFQTGEDSNNNMKYGRFIKLFPSLDIKSFRTLIDMGTFVIDSRIARSRKLLEDAIKQVEAEWGSFTYGSKTIDGIKVTGKSGTSYVVELQQISKTKSTVNNHSLQGVAGAVYRLPELGYVCIVDKDHRQVGYDIVVNRLLALRNDLFIARYINTLKQ